MRPFALVVVAGCTPLPPFQTLETAQPVAAGHVLVSLGAIGGAGRPPGPDVNSTTCCGGGVARVRVGIDGTQDVGVDGYAVGEGVWGSKLIYKRALAEHVALAAGAGGTLDGNARDTSVGADLAAIASTDEHELFGIPHARIYGALRVTGATPLHGGVSRDGGPTGALTAPIGVEIQRGALRLYGEVGVLGVVDHNSAFMNGATGTYFGAGGYAILAVGYVL